MSAIAQVMNQGHNTAMLNLARYVDALEARVVAIEAALSSHAETLRAERAAREAIDGRLALLDKTANQLMDAATQDGGKRSR